MGEKKIVIQTSQRLPSDLWSKVKNWNPSFYHDVYWNIGFLGQEIQEWHCVFDMTYQRPPNDLRPMIRGQNFKFIFLLWCILKYRFFRSRSLNMTFFYWYDLSEANLWPLTSYQWSKIQIHYFTKMRTEVYKR